jgi:CubicO group peptidase (beta-lactamase class C family)
MSTRSRLCICVALLFALPAVPAPASPEKSVRRLDGSRITPAEIEATVTKLMAAAKVPGLGVAILNDNKVVYLHAYGMRNVEEGKPLTADTVMSGLSFTKSVFAVLVMQLVEEGKLDLDVPIVRYLDKPLGEYEKWADLASDERHKLITARMLLSHTAGFPNFRFLNDDGKLDIKFAPGSRYAYSGEGINLLGFVVESVTKKPLDVLMQERIFTPFGMTRTSMLWQPRFEDDYATGYDESGKALGHTRRSSPRAAGSMDTTLNDFSKFVAAMMQGKGLRSKSRAELFKPQIRIHSQAQFPTLRPETTTENDAIRLSYALGWGVFFTPAGKAVFKEGHDDGGRNHFVCFLDKKTAIILLTNSSNGHSIFKELLARLIGDTWTPWKWESYIPYDLPDVRLSTSPRSADP